MSNDETALAPLVQQTEDSPAGRLERIAFMQAVQRLAKDEEDLLRGRLEADADAAEKHGLTFKVEVEDLGTVLRSKPKPRAVLVDKDAFVAWLDIEHPDLTMTVDDVRFDDDTEAVLDTVRELQLALTIHEPKATIEMLARRLLGLIHHEPRVVGPESPEKALKAEGCKVVKGQIVTPDGEVVPGFESRTTDPSLRVSIDAAAKHEHDALLKRRLQIGAATEREDNDNE